MERPVHPACRRVLTVFVVALAAVFSLAAGLAAPVTGAITARSAHAAEPLDGPALAEALRGGGYVLLFRHATTDQSQKDVDRQNLGNCATQRNLSDDGRAQSVALGEAIRRLGIPVGAVLASPYCRTLETAQLAFGHADASDDLISDLSLSEDGARLRLMAALAGLLAAPPEPGTNRVLVTHVLNIADVVGFEIEEGEALVAQPNGAGGYDIVAQVPAARWETLDRAP